MSGIVYAAPYVPPPPPAPKWIRTRHTLTGADGRVWEISNPAGGVFLTQDGIRGMGRPDWTIHHSTSPVVHGARYHGHVAPARTVMLPLYMYHDGSSVEWTELYRAFMAIMRPDIPIRWTVELPDMGTSRSLMIRFTDPGDWVDTLDVRWRGWRHMGLNFVADEQPFWEGRTVEEEWKQSPQVDFIGSDGGPPLHLSRSRTLGSAVVANPGDEAGWPIWMLHGPMQSATVGVGDQTITSPILLDEGEWLRIDTRPAAKSAYDQDGARRTRELGRRKWARIPAGERVPLTLSMVGEGRVEVLFTPLHHEAL